MDIRNELHRALQPLFRRCSPGDCEGHKGRTGRQARGKDKVNYKELVRNAIK